MQRKNLTIVLVSLLVMSFLIYIFQHDSGQSNRKTLKTASAISQEQVENTEDVLAVEASDQAEPEEKEQSDPIDEDMVNPITEEIKAKVREVVEGAVELFKKDQKIVSIGDSLTEGVGDETESGGYVGILNHTFEDNKINIKVENFGKRGNRTDQLLKRLEKEEIATAIKDADIVLITIGANDIMKVVKNNYTNLTMEPFQQERVEYLERLTAIFDEINEINPDTQTYLIGFYNPFDGYFRDIEELELIIDSWNDGGKALSEVYENVHYIPIKDLFENSNTNLLADDHFHPNTSGYKRMAERILDHLKDSNEETEIFQADVES